MTSFAGKGSNFSIFHVPKWHLGDLCSIQGSAAHFLGDTGQVGLLHYSSVPPCVY